MPDKGRLPGIIEAKKTKVGPANVLEQAKRYARAASDGPGSWHGFRVPFLYATNGEVIHFLDVRSARNLSRRIEQFHTADALEEMFGRPAGFEWLQANPVAIEKLRPYQKKAIEAVEAALSVGRRAMLVAMATGTGKTFMTVAQIYRLLESKAVRRALFLVDRRALAARRCGSSRPSPRPRASSSIRNTTSSASASAARTLTTTSLTIPRSCPAAT